MVKRLRHRPFTAVTRVRFSLGSFKAYLVDWNSFVNDRHADVAQLAEQLICNQQVIGSSPIIGFYGPLAQLVRAPPCHGGGRGFKSRLGRFFSYNRVRDLSSAGRASALQAEGHRFEPYRSHSIQLYRAGPCGGTGRRAGLKILLWKHSTGSIPVTGIDMAFISKEKRICVCSSAG